MRLLKYLMAVLGVVLVAVAIGYVPQALGHHPMQPVKIDACQSKKPPVMFSHVQHMKAQGDEIDCKTCHHTGDTGKACADCHKKPQGELGTCSDMSTSKNPLHVRCIGCHRDLEKKDITTGPTRCNDCHKAS